MYAMLHLQRLTRSNEVLASFPVSALSPNVRVHLYRLRGFYCGVHAAFMDAAQQRGRFFCRIDVQPTAPPFCRARAGGYRIHAARNGRHAFCVPFCCN